jgi:hypothetical protein
MNTNNEDELNSILDKHNELKELLQEEYTAWNIDAKTLGHLKASLASILWRIKTEPFKQLRRELYDVLQIIKM